MFLDNVVSIDGRVISDIEGFVDSVNKTISDICNKNCLSVSVPKFWAILDFVGDKLLHDVDLILLDDSFLSKEKRSFEALFEVFRCPLAVIDLNGVPIFTDKVNEERRFIVDSDVYCMVLVLCFIVSIAIVRYSPQLDSRFPVSERRFYLTKDDVHASVREYLFIHNIEPFKIDNFSDFFVRAYAKFNFYLFDHVYYR